MDKSNVKIKGIGKGKAKSSGRYNTLKNVYRGVAFYDEEHKLTATNVTFSHRGISIQRSKRKNPIGEYRVSYAVYFPYANRDGFKIGWYTSKDKAITAADRAADRMIRNVRASSLNRSKKRKVK